MEDSSGNYTEATSGLQLGSQVSTMMATNSAAGPVAAKRAMRADACRNYEKLLAAAASAFAERGADDVSLEEIAKRAGVGIGTFYRHFPTRQALLETMYLDQVQALGTLAEQLLRTESPAEALAAWMRALVAFTKTKRSLSAALTASLGKDAELLTSCKTILTDSTQAILKAAQRAGLARADISGADVIRLAHSVRVAADFASEDPGQAERMLSVVVAGLLSQPADRQA